MIALDATIGNGNDTLFLATNTKLVYGLDIQEKAILNTQARLKDCDNYKLYLKNFQNVDELENNFDIVMYNLGYLPHSDKVITTNHQDFIISLSKVLNKLNNHGLISIIFYFHQEGFKEYYAFLNFLKENKQLKVLHTYKQPKWLSPKLYILEIEKNT